MMDHPNIAKVLDAGQTDSRRPYFVMELVNGLPVTTYCDGQHLTPKERLELYLSIRQAVQHAHQKKIIHRDLKPSNILVALYDGRAVPTIIDFGVAKATSQTRTEKTVFTQFGLVVGTLEYVSPEQAQHNQLDIDTRSDIYSLGVVLYELLTGETPFDRELLRSAAFDEMLRIIREEEPSKPSTKLAGSQSLPSIAASRRIEPAKLGNMIQAELDWIVMKAMEKDRKRRYETVGKLAEDVGHCLDDKPVEACPPSTAYRFQNFWRRNKAALLTASIVAASLLVATAVSLRQASIVRSALSSEQVARQQAERAERRASAEAARSQQVVRFLSDMLAAAGPKVARGRDATLLKEVLAQTATRIETELRDEPAISLARLGKSQAFIGELAAAQRNAEQGVEMARVLDDQETLADCLLIRAEAFKTWNMNTAEAIPIYQEALAIYGGLKNRRTEEAKCPRGLAGTQTLDPHSLTLARRAHGIFSEELGDNHPDTVDSLWNVGQLLLIQDHASEAEPVLRETLRMMEIIFEKNHPLNHIVRIKLASSLALQGKWSEANIVIDEAPTDIQPNELHYANLYYLNLFDFLVHYDQLDEAKRVLEKMEVNADGPADAAYGFARLKAVTETSAAASSHW